MIMTKSSVISSLWDDVIQTEDTARHNWVEDSSAPLGFSPGNKVILSWDADTQSTPIDATGILTYTQAEVKEVLKTPEWSPDVL